MHNALLLGDSIRLGYQPTVAEALSDWNVAGPEENCRSSRDLAANLDRWALARLRAPTIVHLNAGLHDLRRSEDSAWNNHVDPGEYRTHLSATFDRLMAHRHVGAGRVIVATTTPVDGTRQNVTSSSHRHLDDVVRYNAVLLEETERRRLAVNDLFAVVRGAAHDLLGADGVHLTEGGYRTIGWRVAEAIRSRARAS